MLHTGLKDIGGAAPTPFQTKAEEMKWLKDGSWCYQKWSPALGSLVIDEDRPPLQHAKLVEALQLVLPIILQPYMIHGFHATRPLAGNMTGVTTFQLDVSNRTKGHNTVWECLEALTVLICAADQWTSAPTGHTQAVAGCHACPTSTGRILLIRLLNSSNTCYINASVRAWLFAVSHLQVADILKFGTQEQAWRDLYNARKPLHVHAVRSWRRLLRNWPNLHQQQDACEFLEHLLGAGRPPVLQGRWESRIVSDADGTETREQHHTHKSITLNFPNPNHPATLQNLIDHWHNGGTYLQACTHPSRVLLLRLSRFQSSENHGTIKVHTRVDIPTSVHVPCFSDPRHGEDCRSIPYLVVACVLHCGATIHAGHYTVRYINHLPPSTAPHAPPAMASRRQQAHRAY